jgi:Protein of unknown function (DUF4446)
VPLDKTLADWLTVGAATLSILALLVALLALRRSRRPAFRAGAPPPRAPRRVTETSAVTPRHSGDLAAEVAALRSELADALRHLAVVRYDAFGDMGGQLSWSLALLDDSGNGMVLTSIHGRSDSRTYAKNIRGWTCEQQLSPEEIEAIDFARG